MSQFDISTIDQHPVSADRVAGCLIGQAVGDMMGLPFENLSPRRIAKLADFTRPQFLFGYGAGSDDTEHAGLTADALVDAAGDAIRFQRRLAANLRRWFLAGPPGIGLATLRACVKLCLGFPLDRCGVRSAGNGPVMRAPIIGLLAPSQRLAEFVRVSTRLTHTDPRAELGSLLIARLARLAAIIDPHQGADWLDAQLQSLAPDPDLDLLSANLALATDCLRQGQSLDTFAHRLGLSGGVSGFVAHTVPVAVVAFFLYANDYRTGIEQTILAGGDTDTTAAIVGALIGARVGVEGIPQQWRDRHLDWPWTLSRLQRMTRPPAVYWPLVLLRNLAFFAVVLSHAICRLVR